MTARLAAAILGLALVSVSCGVDVQGPGTPECFDPDGSETATATILQLQAVPSTEWGPCIEELRVGWDYVSQFAESGRAVFWLDSDRVGDRFLEVELTPSCDPGGAVSTGSPRPGIERLVAIEEEPGEVAIAIVPVAPRHEGDARALVTSTIGTKMEGRTLAPFVDDSSGSASDRILAALRSVGRVLVLDDAEVATGTVELQRAGHDPRVGISVEKALDEIADDLGSPVYRAEWFHIFEGGCIVYRFEAKGSGSESIASNVRDALGFYPLGELRDAARRAGYDV